MVHVVCVVYVCVCVCVCGVCVCACSCACVCACMVFPLYLSFFPFLTYVFLFLHLHFTYYSSLLSFIPSSFLFLGTCSFMKTGNFTVQNDGQIGSICCDYFILMSQTGLCNVHWCLFRHQCDLPERFGKKDLLVIPIAKDVTS